MNQTHAEHFLSACGTDQPLRLSVAKTGEAASENWVFARPFVVIGRRSDSDLVLDHWQISRRHAYLQYLDGGFICIDLGSRTGTYGGEEGERAGWIARDQVIQVGPYEVRPEWPLSRPAHEPSDLPGVIWELPQKAVGSAIWRMKRQIVLVGRSPACRVRIVERDVSKFHCSLVRTRLGVWVVDLLGQGGVFVNDEPIRSARLEDGDELRIGGHVLRPRYDAPLPVLAEPAEPFRFDAMRDRPQEVLDHLPALTTGFPGKVVAPKLTFPAPAMPPAGVNLAAILQGQGHTIDPTMMVMVQQFSLMQQQMFDQFHQTMLAMFEGFSAMHREQSETMREEMEQVRKLSREIEELQTETQRLLEETRKKPANPPRPGLSPRTPLPARPPGEMALSGPPEADIHALLVRRLTTMQDERQGRWQKILGMMSSRS